MGRPTLALLSTENLLHNLTVLQQHAPRARVIAMIKANAYGHGLRSVALRLERHVEYLGVASIDEAMALRKVGIRTPIVLMEGVFQQDELLIASCQDFHVVVHDNEHLVWLDSLTIPLPLTVWLKIDTGLGRLGFSLEQVPDAYAVLMRSVSVKKPIGVMSHFACADDRMHNLNQLQIDRFIAMTADKPGPKSLCNSAGIFAFSDHHYEVIRPGLALYGISPLAGVAASTLGLKPVMTLKARLMVVRMVRKGTSIGYGARFMCPEDMPVGVVSIGYGDGYPRTAHDGTPVLVNNVRCPLIGRVSMDMLTVDLRAYPAAKANDYVTLWGEGLPLEDVAPFTNNSPYDLLTGIQSRVAFYWTKL